MTSSSSKMAIFLFFLASLIAPLQGQQVVLHGGSYQQSPSRCLVSNRFTGSCSCPPSFQSSCYDALLHSNTTIDASNTVVYSPSSARVSSTFCLCDRTAGLSIAAVFGGAYQRDDDDSCRHQNPHTSSCSCPPGFNPIPTRSLVFQLGTSDALIGSHTFLCVNPSSSKPVGTTATDSSAFLLNSNPATVQVLNNFHGVYAISSNQSSLKCLLGNPVPGLRPSRYLSSINAQACNCPNSACGASFFWLTDELGPFPFTYQRLVICESSMQLPVSSATPRNKLMFGYQKWQTTPKDGLGLGYFHWIADGSQGTPMDSKFAENGNFGLWPDTTEFPPSNLTSTALKRPDGSFTTLYDAYLPQTVDLHVQWLQYYGLDGMWLQLFFDGRVLKDGNLFSVLQLRQWSERYSRVFGLMWDISGTNSDNLVGLLQADVQRMSQNGVFNSSASLRCLQLLKSSGLAVMGGVSFYWRSQLGGSGENFSSVYNTLDIISPWTVGVYSFDNYVSSAPVAHPGSGWPNHAVHSQGKNINNSPRLGGTFWQTQVDALETSVMSQPSFSHVYVAMFDEFDESTAMTKAAESYLDRPVGEFLSLDVDGFHVPNDHYLCLASRQTYRQQQPLPINFLYTFRSSTRRSTKP